MTNEEKELLLKDLCGRLPYGVRCQVPTEDELSMVLTGKRLNYFCFHKDSFGLDYSHEIEVVLDPWNSDKVIKPYLRPMSTMTEEELKEFTSFASQSMHRFICDTTNTDHWYNNYEEEDWLNAHHFDYRGLIEKGLALEAPEGMYDK